MARDKEHPHLFPVFTLRPKLHAGSFTPGSCRAEGLTAWGRGWVVRNLGIAPGASIASRTVTTCRRGAGTDLLADKSAGLGQQLARSGKRVVLDSCD